jgi:hypothetical protein
MDAETYYRVSVFLWKVTLVAGSATVIIYFFQLMKMNAAIKAQNLAWLVRYLQDKDVRHARFIVTNKLATKALADWTLRNERKQRPHVPRMA